MRLNFPSKTSTNIHKQLTVKQTRHEHAQEACCRLDKHL